MTLCRVALAAFFGLALVLEDDGDFGVIPCLAEDTSLSPDERSRSLPSEDCRRLYRAPSGPRHRAPSLLDAVHGGFCLLTWFLPRERRRLKIYPTPGFDF